MQANEKRCWAIVVSLCAAVLLGAFLFAPPLFQIGYDPLAPEPVTAAQLIKVDLNLASADILKSLPGLGEKKAAAIIEYRSKHGEFKDIDEILCVDGISERDFKNWQPYLYIR